MSRAFVSLKHFEVNFPVFWRMSKRAKNNQRSSSASQSPGTSGSPYPLGLASCSLLLPSALSFHRRCIFCCFGCMKRISLQCSMMMAKHKRTIALKEFISFQGTCRTHRDTLSPVGLVWIWISKHMLDSVPFDLRPFPTPFDCVEPRRSYISYIYIYYMCVFEQGDIP